MLLPFVVLMIPLVKILPPFYRWLVRKRIYRWYFALRKVDPELEEIDYAQCDQCLLELDKLEAELKNISIPLAYTDEFYNLRLHIEMVRNKLNEHQQQYRDAHTKQDEKA